MKENRTMLRPPERKQLRLVLVDDDRDFLALLRTWLGSRYEIICLPDGEGLMEELCDIEPDLVIMDLHMPEQDGFSLCRKIRAEKRFKFLPVLFLTASDANDDFAKNMRAGGNALLNKPIQKKNLHSAIHKFLLSYAMA